jgi:hypothetical protein
MVNEEYDEESLAKEEEKDHGDCETKGDVTVCEVDTTVWKCWQQPDANPIADSKGTVTVSGYCKPPTNPHANECMHFMSSSGKQGWACLWGPTSEGSALVESKTENKFIGMVAKMAG